MRQYVLLKSLMILAVAVALGGAACLGFRHTSEVWGDTAVTQVRADRVVQEALMMVATPPPDPEVDYLLQLDAEDFTTYTHPVYGFSFRYPKDFELLTATWGDEEVIDVHHPTLPLAIRVSIHPFDPDGALVADIASLPDTYDLEPPAGADSPAVGWIDADVQGAVW